MPVRALRTVGMVQVQSRRFGWWGACHEDVLLTLGALPKQTVAHCQEGKVTKAVCVGTVAYMGKVSEISQRQADHVDREDLLASREPPGPATRGWLPVQRCSQGHCEGLDESEVQTIPQLVLSRCLASFG